MTRFPALERTLRIVATLTLCMALAAGLGATATPLTASASSLYVVPGNSIQVPAGGTGYLQVRGIALQPQASLPSTTFALASQQPLAGDPLRTTVYYGIDWGYSDSAPQQVALALWWAQEHSWRDTDHTTAERIATAAANAPGIPSWNPDGRSLVTAVSQGQVSISELALTPLAQTPFVGNGTLSIRNTSGTDMVLYLPYGTLFTNVSGAAIVWATAAGGAPPQASPTSGPAQPTATQAIPTATPVAPAPSSTPVTRKGGPPPPPPAPQQSTATDTPLPPIGSKGATATPIVAPPTDVPTDTPTTQPTNTPQPTDTPVPTSTQPVAPPQPDTTGKAPTKAPPAQEKANQQGTGTPKGDQSTADQPQQAPSHSVEGPLPPSPQPTGAATATGNGSGSDAPSDAAPPLPVDTSITGPPLPVNTSVTGPPPPVSTESAKATVPFPVLTTYPTAASGQTDATKPPPAVETVQEKPTAPTSDSPPPGGADVSPPAPTPAPPPVDKQTEPPVIVVPGGTTDGAPSGSADSGVPSGQQGSPPTESPVTGAGPSTLPLWLAAAALFMLFGGWTLRRVARASAPAK